MSALKKGLGKFAQWGIDQSKSIGRHLGYGSVIKSLNKDPPPPPATIPLPDEAEIARLRRKKAAQRAGGRASTMLASDSATNSDTFGP
jgi:hypothetical protein